MSSLCDSHNLKYENNPSISYPIDSYDILSDKSESDSLYDDVIDGPPDTNNNASPGILHLGGVTSDSSCTDSSLYENCGVTKPVKTKMKLGMKLNLNLKKLYGLRRNKSSKSIVEEERIEEPNTDSADTSDDEDGELYMELDEDVHSRLVNHPSSIRHYIRRSLPPIPPGGKGQSDAEYIPEAEDSESEAYDISTYMEMDTSVQELVDTDLTYDDIITTNAAKADERFTEQISSMNDDITRCGSSDDEVQDESDVTSVKQPVCNKPPIPINKPKLKSSYMIAETQRKLQRIVASDKKSSEICHDIDGENKKGYEKPNDNIQPIDVAEPNTDVKPSHIRKTTHVRTYSTELSVDTIATDQSDTTDAQIQVYIQNKHLQ